MLPDRSLPPGIPPVYVAAFGPEGGPAGVRLLEELRRAGISAVTDYRSTTLKAHLRQADRAGSRYTILLGDDEVRRGSVVVRNMDTKAQNDVSFADISRSLLSQISPS